MPKEIRSLPQIAAAAFGFSSVAAGAFGAHALAARLSSTDLEIWQTAAHYQLVHAVALLALSALPASAGRRRVCICWIFGILLFSGSLYILVLTDVRKLGMITPLGGLCLLAGWLSLAFIRSNPPSKQENHA